MELLGFGELALSLQQPAEVADEGKSVRMVPPESPLLYLESPTNEWLGFGELALSFQQLSHPGYRTESTWMVPPESPLQSFQSPTKAQVSLVESTLLVEKFTEFVDRVQGVVMIDSHRRFLLLDGHLQLRHLLVLQVHGRGTAGDLVCRPMQLLVNLAAIVRG